MNAEAWIVIGIQAAALVYHAGAVTAMLRNHDRRLEKIESTSQKMLTDVARLQGRKDKYEYSGVS